MAEQSKWINDVGPVGLARHADGTPFTPDDYEAAGMERPTEAQIQRWLDEDHRETLKHIEVLGPAIRAELKKRGIRI